MWYGGMGGARGRCKVGGPAGNLRVIGCAVGICWYLRVIRCVVIWVERLHHGAADHRAAAPNNNGIIPRKCTFSIHFARCIIKVY